MLDIESFKQELMLRSFIGGFPAHPGYDTGVCFNLGTKEHIFGIGYKIEREQTLPDDATHRVNKWDKIIELSEDDEWQKEAQRLHQEVQEYIKPFKMKAVFIPGTN